MKYADDQLTRPQYDGQSDYGYGRRSVLVRNGKRQLLHQRGYKAWSGIGQTQHVPATWSLWDDAASNTVDRKTDIHEGRMTPEILAGLAPRICEFLGMTFDIGLIRLDRTLLLDVEGDAVPPPVKPRKAPTPSPRVDGNALYRIVERDDRPAMATYLIDEQRRGIVAYSLYAIGTAYAENGRGFERNVTSLAEHGLSPTPEGAIELYVADARKRLADAEATRRSAAANVKTYRALLRTMAKQAAQAAAEAAAIAEKA